MTPETVNLVLGIGGVAGTLLGSIVGAIAGYKGALKTVRVQLDHEDQTRFHNDRLSACASFLECLRRHTNLMIRARERLDKPPTAEDTQELNAIGTEVGAAIERLNLLASAEVNRLAEDLYRFCIPASRTLGKNPTVDDFKEFSKTFQEKRNVLRAAMRRDLSVAHDVGIE